VKRRWGDEDRKEKEWSCVKRKYKIELRRGAEQNEKQG
jgi:hypothetical protein